MCIDAAPLKRIWFDWQLNGRNPELDFTMGALDFSTRHAILAAYNINPNYIHIATQFKVDPRTVKRWVKRGEMGSLDARRSSGRKPALSVAAATKAGELLLSGKFDNCHQVAVELVKEGLTSTVVHPTTLSRHAKARAAALGTPIRAHRGKPEKALTEKNKGQRLAFAKANKSTSWGHVMITDRKKFLFRYPGSVVKRVEWLRQGQHRVASRPNNPQVVNMYAGITSHGVTRPHLVTGTSKLATNFKNKKGQASRNITSQEYERVCLETLLPEGDRLFRRAGIDSWTLQQDNDPTHKAASERALSAWNTRGRKKVVILKDWPPNSPDLSPIENAWAHVQAKVDAAGCQNLDEFKHTLHHTWMNLDKTYLTALMSSVPRRLDACTAAEGAKTHY